MAAITNLDDYVARLTASTQETVWWWKDNRIDGVAIPSSQQGRWLDLWKHSGQPSHGDTPPTSAAAPTRETAGALGQTNPGGGEELYLNSLSVCGGVNAATTVGCLMVYDRLVHISGLSGTVTSAQTVGGTLTRYTGAEAAGNVAMVTVYTLIGTTVTTVTANYTNENGTSGRTSEPQQTGGTGYREQGRAILLPLAAGDRGIRSVESVTLLGTTGTAGDFGVSIIRPIAIVPFLLPGAGGYRELVFNSPILPKIKTDACLSFLFLPSVALINLNLMGHCSFITK